VATIAYVNTDQLLDYDYFIWSLLTTTNADGAPVSYHGTADRTVQVDGTFGAGGTIVIQGSNDLSNPTNWFTLTNPLGAAALSLTAAALKLIGESPVWIRPLVTGGDGTTSLNVRLCVRRNRANG
jgi:hypothetical protein